MLITSLVQLGLILSNGIEHTLLSWISSCVGYISGGNNVCDIRLRLYSSCNEFEYEEYPVDGTLQLFDSHLYDRSNVNTIIFALPYLTGIDDEDIQEIIRALCRRCIYNIIVLDNSCNINTRNVVSYPTTMLQIYTDAKRYADVLNMALGKDYLRGENIIGIGYSLGAQMVGHVCRLLQKRCGLIYAFDPAGPFYLPEDYGMSGLLPHLRLVSRGDGDLVVLVGCNEGVIGTPFHSGDVNVHVNGGTVQPGCSALSMTCSHRFCRKILLDSITFPQLCQARVCKSKNWFEKGLCNYREVFTINVNPEKKYSLHTYDPIDVYMDTLQTDSCQGYQGSVQ